MKKPKIAFEREEAALQAYQFKLTKLEGIVNGELISSMKINPSIEWFATWHDDDIGVVALGAKFPYRKDKGDADTYSRLLERVKSVIKRIKNSKNKSEKQTNKKAAIEEEIGSLKEQIASYVNQCSNLMEENEALKKKNSRLEEKNLRLLKNSEKIFSIAQTNPNFNDI